MKASFRLAMVATFVTGCAGATSPGQNTDATLHAPKQKQAKNIKEDDQLFIEGLARICSCGLHIDPKQDPTSYAMRTTECMEKNASTDELRNFLHAMAAADGADRLLLWGRAMSRAGIEKCPMATLYASRMNGAASPEESSPSTGFGVRGLVGSNLETPTTSKEPSDRDAIRRSIRSELSRIRHCYEKQLVLDPKLEGTVVAEFTISAAGTVTSSKASGLGNTEVEACVAKVIETIQFAKPVHGNKVHIRYPFRFQPAQ